MPSSHRNTHGNANRRIANPEYGCYTDLVRNEGNGGEDVKNWRYVIFTMLLALLWTTWCRAGILDELTGIVEGLVGDGSAHVMSEAEMVDLAKERLREKYGLEFENEAEKKTYSHENGKESNPMVLRAYAHPAGKEQEQCYIIVKEPNTVMDNYSICEYSNAILAVVNDEAKQFGLEASARVSYPATEERLESGLEADDILHRKDCTIIFEPQAGVDGEASSNIPLIRRWMRFLYSRDYKWHFRLCDERVPSNIIFTLDPGDNGFSSEEDWSDELLAEYISEGLGKISRQEAP